MPPAREMCTSRELPVAPDSVCYLSMTIGQRSQPAVQVVGSLRLMHLSGPPDRRLAQLLAAQHGCVARRQLLAAGLSRTQIQTRIARGQLERAHRGVYSVIGAPDQPLRRETAALLACGPAAALGRMTAARMWKLIPTARDTDRIDIVMPTGSRGRSRAGIQIRQTTTLTTNDLRRNHGLPVTSPERTLIDIASLDSVGNRTLETALDEALGQRITSLTKLTEQIRNHQAQPGAARLNHLIAARTTSTITKRQAEALFLSLIRQAGLPDPETQAKVGVFEIDAYWPQARFAVEYDSHQWHALKTNFERDRRKDRALQRLSIQVLRITWEQMRNDALALMVDIATTIERRTAT